jgi:hypothetical protein
MAGLAPAIPAPAVPAVSCAVLRARAGGDGRVKPGHDGSRRPVRYVNRYGTKYNAVAFLRQLKNRVGRKSASSGRCFPRTTSSATAAPRNGDIVTPLWVTAR